MSNDQVQEDWRVRVKNLLSSECAPINITKPVQAMDRYSLDFDPNFKNMLLKAPQFAQINLNDQTVNNNFGKLTYVKRTDLKLEKQNESTKFIDATICAHHDSFNVHHSSDINIADVDKMCDKTASDPNNTLLQYMRNEHKDAVVSNKEEVFIKCSSLTTDVMVKECNVDMLHLTDNETPTNKETKCSTSTLEETDCSKSSMQCCKAATSDAFSNKYKTTFEIPFDLNNSNLKSLHVIENCNNIIQCTEEKSIPNQFKNKMVVNFKNGFQTSSQTSVLKELWNNELNTAAQNHTSNIRKKKTLNDSIIVLSDDPGDSDDDIEDKQQFMKVKEIDFDNLNHFNSMSDEGTNAEDNDTENKENNCSINTFFQESTDFNDTLEEVTQILKFLDRNGKYNDLSNSNLRCDTSKMINSPKSPKIKQSTFTKLSKKIDVEPPKEIKIPLTKFTKVNHVNTNNSPKTFATSNAKPKLEIRTAFNTNTSKIKQFKTPKRIEVKATKHNGSNNKQFAHIVSPIGTYIKKSGTTPLLTAYSSKPQSYTSHTASRELVFDPRKGRNEESYNIPIVSHALPKKAYISSDLKHYVDERTPITIPEVSKVKKYIETAKLPAVLRHDGKYKLPIAGSGSGSKPKLPFNKKTGSKACENSSHAINASLANLSITTGDVSLYTIKDAQRL